MVRGRNKRIGSRSRTRRSVQRRRAVTRRRRRGGLANGQNLHKEEIRTTATFLPIPEPTRSRSYLQAFNAWWIRGLNNIRLVIGWLTFSTMPSALKKETIKEYGLQWPIDITNKAVVNPIGPQDDILVPRELASSVYLSIDNLIAPSNVFPTLIRGTPNRAPPPYDGSFPGFDQYYLCQYDRYRIKRVHMTFVSPTTRDKQVGRFHIGFSPFGVDELVEYLGPAANQKLLLPTPESVMNSSYYRSITLGSRATINWTPTGYWSEWRRLGTFCDQSTASVENLDWTKGVGTSPFGRLLFVREALAADDVKRASNFLDQEKSTLNVQFTVHVEFQGYQALDVTVKSEGASKRLLRGYFLQSYYVPSAGVYNVRDVAIKAKEPFLSLDDMEI